MKGKQLLMALLIVIVICGIISYISFTFYASLTPPPPPPPALTPTPSPTPIPQEEAIAKVKVHIIEVEKGTITEEDIRIDKVELRPPTKEEERDIRVHTWRDPPELIWVTYITLLFEDAGPREGKVILDAYTGDFVYSVFSRATPRALTWLGQVIK